MAIVCSNKWIGKIGSSSKWIVKKVQVPLQIFFVCRKLKIHFKKAIERAGYNRRIKFAIDVVATDICVGK